MALASDVAKSEIRAVFESGAVYADRWSQDVRNTLDVPDPLTEVIASALRLNKSVVVSGNAGDGKSHLAQRVLDGISPRCILEVTRKLAQPSTLPEDALIFVRDASGLSDDQVVSWVAAARAAHAPLLLTINEGPLASLASRSGNGFFQQIRQVLHDRALGRDTADPADTLIVSLAGRQLTRSSFIHGLLERLLPVIGPCSTCGKAKDCPRVVGAKLLMKSKRAKDRLELLLRLLTDSGQHLSAREIWTFLIDLFFGWECPPGGDEVNRLSGFFWMRIFEGNSKLAHQVAVQFDPIAVPLAREDVAMWQGQSDQIDIEMGYPGTSPARLASKVAQEAGLRAFASTKRFYFFFARKLDAESLLARRSLAPNFGRQLQQAMDDPRPAIRELVGLINRYRLNEETQNELLISRHHGFAAHRRPTGLGAAARQPIERLGILVPFMSDARAYTQSGFFPTKFYLHWIGSEQLFTIDFQTWQRLQEERTLTVDRDQETLDFAIDLFMAQADVPAIDDPEILVFDHRRQEKTILRIRPEARRIEVIG